MDIRVSLFIAIKGKRKTNIYFLETFASRPSTQKFLFVTLINISQLLRESFISLFQTLSRYFLCHHKILRRRNCSAPVPLTQKQ